MSISKQTKAIHCTFPDADAYGSLGMPVYYTAAYEFADADTMADTFCGRINKPDYSRVMNPTVTFFEKKIKKITEARNVIALTSGMAAISNTLIAVAKAGKNIVTSRHMFGNTYSFITQTMKRWGVEARCIDLTDINAVKHAVDENSCCIFLEILTNPQIEVANLQELSLIATSYQIPLIADTTAIPFTQFSAKDLGVDIEILSSTKYLSGGGTSIGGIVIDYGTSPGIGNRIKNELLFNLGAYMSPQVSYMQSLGLETLDARYRVQNENTRKVATALRKHPNVVKVNYVGFEDNPFHKLAAEQFGDTYGAMFTIDLANKGACFCFLNHLQLVRRATNLFDNKSLAIHPASTIFGNYSDADRAAMDVYDTTIRLSIGLENADDVIADLTQALNSIDK